MAMGTGFEKFLRFGEGRRMKRLAEQAAYIATLEPEFRALSDAELRAKTAEFRQRLANGEDARRPPVRGVRRCPRGARSASPTSACSTSR